MIPVPGGVQIWIATTHTDMRRGMHGLALQVQQGVHRDPHPGDLYIFHGWRGDMVKILWHDALGMSLFAKRMESGRFVRPAAVDCVVAISASQMACMFEDIGWRHQLTTWRPTAAG